ncbi:MAG: 1-acyl-sn-glycerol-3-phosphate acyltransferase [Acidobacteria bacterium]|nr:MAG: 1-acyl-sn-glycerol-3-phosphate acyltransferase [Acidobacteriota bacterium]
MDTSEIDKHTSRASRIAELRSTPADARPAPTGKYRLLSRLRSYFVFAPLIWLYTVVMGLLSLPTSVFSNSGRVQHDFARVWAWLIMKTIFSPVTVMGLEKIDTTRPHVYAVNHGSALDIPVLYVHLPFQFRIAFKKELLKYPIVGWHLRRSGQVCIDQQNPAGSIGAIRSARKRLKRGFLAIKSQVDVVPVALVGTYELLPMDTYHIKCRPLEMRVGEPISTAVLTLDEMDTLSAKVQSAMEELYYANETP